MLSFFVCVCEKLATSHYLSSGFLLKRPNCDNIADAQAQAAAVMAGVWAKEGNNLLAEGTSTTFPYL